MSDVFIDNSVTNNIGPIFGYTVVKWLESTVEFDEDDGWCGAGLLLGDDYAWVVDISKIVDRLSPDTCRYYVQECRNCLDNLIAEYVRSIVYTTVYSCLYCCGEESAPDWRHLFRIIYFHDENFTMDFPWCQSTHIRKNGKDPKLDMIQRYLCVDCTHQFHVDDNNFPFRRVRVYHGVDCPDCKSRQVIKDGKYENDGAQRYNCRTCGRKFRLEYKQKNPKQKKPKQKKPKPVVTELVDECIYCKSKNIRKNGHRKTGKGFVQKYSCNDCKKIFSTGPGRGRWAKHTIEEIRKIAQARGGDCLSDEYINTTHPMKFVCGKGHEWVTTFQTIYYNGTWCPDCADVAWRPGGVKGKGLFKYTFNEIRQRVKARGGTVISKRADYNMGVSSRLWIRCEHGHKWLAITEDIIRGKTWCKRCGGQGGRDKKENKKYRKKLIDIDDAWRIARQGYIRNGRLYVIKFRAELKEKGFRQAQIDTYPRQIQNKLDREKKK